MSDLANQLRAAVEAALKGGRVLAIHLFGIEHAERLKATALKSLAEQAGLGESFATELRKGVRLAEFVVMKR